MYELTQLLWRCLTQFLSGFKIYETRPQKVGLVYFGFNHDVTPSESDTFTVNMPCSDEILSFFKGYFNKFNMLSYSRCRACWNIWIFYISLLALPVFWPAPAHASIIHIRNDMGGSVERRMAELDRLRYRGDQVRIVGTCISSCTLYLGLPNTCVSPGARLGFHGPRGRAFPITRQEFDRVSMLMARQYPPQIRAWFWQEARLRVDGYYLLSGEEAIRMGARACA